MRKINLILLMFVVFNQIFLKENSYNGKYINNNGAIKSNHFNLY
jgi:hypothetical protein